MRFEEALFAHLKAFTGLKSLVDERIYPLVLPQKAVLPAVTYQKISGERLHKLQGDTGFTRPVYQLSCWAENYAQCKAVAEQVRLSLQNYSGFMGGTEGVAVGAVLLEGEAEGYESDTGTFYINMDFQFYYSEQV
jgi:hypothetical protein